MTEATDGDDASELLLHSSALRSSADLNGLFDTDSFSERVRETLHRRETVRPTASLALFLKISV